MASRMVLVRVGDSKHLSIDASTIMTKTSGALLVTLRDGVFDEELRGVKLGTCTVLVRAFAGALTWSSAVAATPAFELEGLSTLSDLAEGALAAGTLFVHVQLPASAAAAGAGAGGGTLPFYLDAATVSRRLPSLSPHEVELFLIKPVFDEFRQKLLLGLFKSHDVSSIATRMQSIVETTTRHRICMYSGVVLHGPIPVASSQASTSLLFSIFGSLVSYAKVGPVHAIAREFEIYSRVHAGMSVPTMPLPTSAFNIPGHATMALFMPLYSLAAAEAVFALAPGHSTPRLVLATNVGLCCLASIDALSRSGYAHGDIKPSNLMLGQSGVVSLIDLGAAQPLGQLFVEYSSYSLGEPGISSVDFDLVCLGSTLAFFEHEITPDQRPSRAQLHAKLASVGEPSPVTRLALQCLSPVLELHPRRPSVLELAEALEAATRGLPGVLSLERVWPTASSPSG